MLVDSIIKILSRIADMPKYNNLLTAFQKMFYTRNNHWSMSSFRAIENIIEPSNCTKDSILSFPD